MKILWLSRWFPYPPDNGAKIRGLNLIKNLSEDNLIDLISFTSEEPSPESIQNLEKYCRQVDHTRYFPFHPKSAKSTLAFFSPTPRSIIDTHNIAFQEKVDAACNRNSYDAVVAREFEMAHYVLKAPIPIKIFEEIELTQFYDQSQAEGNPLRKFRTKMTWWKMCRYHQSILNQFSGGTVVSENERNILLQNISTKTPVQVIPNGVDVEHYAGDYGEQQPYTIIYTGALTYQANYDAVLYFLIEIFPYIRRECPQAQFKITGKTDGVDLSKLPLDEHVVFTGYLPDIRPALKQSSVCIIPLRVGGGTRLKILEALAAGIPVVTTKKGMEGLNLIPQHDILVADQPEEFSQAVIGLLQNPEIGLVLRQNGLAAVNKIYNWSAITKIFSDFISGFSQKPA